MLMRDLGSSLPRNFSSAVPTSSFFSHDTSSPC
jgi:hypothetical protein